MSAVTRAFAWFPTVVDGRMVWLRTFYRVYRNGGASLALAIPDDAL